MTSEIKSIIDSFPCVGLEDIDVVRLMDRIDTKFVFSLDKVKDLVAYMKKDYRVLEVNGIRIPDYTTTYLDTPEYLFYNQHVTGRTGRLKVRFRKYNSNGKTYLEIKKKLRKNRTIKWRIENEPVNGSYNKTADRFIRSRIPYDTESLRPVLNNFFSRITFVNLDLHERITLDLGLSYSSNETVSVSIPSVAIAELKSEVFASRSLFAAVLRQFGIYPTGFSKYCIGNALANELPRKNILKPKILLIKRIENEYNESHAI
jgi:hypothetical protein